MRTPVRFRVNRLFGEFDHEIEFPEEHEFAIIYGPNGVGKTKLFEAIRAMSRLNMGALDRVPFESASIEYSDASSLTVQRLDGRLASTLVVEGRVENWECSPDQYVSGHMYVRGSEWVEEVPGLWVDQTDGETLSEEEFRARHGLADDGGAPEAFREFSDENATYLIETQRLLAKPASMAGLNAYRTYQGSLGRRRGRPNSVSTVGRYAADIQNRLRAALTDNSRTTATLDRTFPQRLLQDTAPTQVSEQDIRKRYSIQNQQRQRLARLSLIGPEPDFDLPIRDLAEWEIKVLWLYLDDTEDKLATFESVVARAELLEEIVNRRFLRKNLSINAEEGLVIRTANGSRIAPEDLSSGEQHELIMFYDMLFRVEPGSLVLIDEPEISLHVAWQRHYMDDMVRVSNLSRARMLIATHSPQIIGKWRSHTTSIGNKPKKKRAARSD